jgi:hypothetical protein
MPGTVIQAGDGRAFVVEARDGRYVLTGSHCLPFLPPTTPASYTEERTYHDFLGPLGGPCTVSAECVFVDPVADLAVLCWPDGQELAEQWDAYQALTERATPFRIGRLRFRCPPHRLPDGTQLPGLRRAVSTARLLSLDGQWFSCRVESLGPGHSLHISDAAQPICGGMSGSPVILPDGSAVGMACISTKGTREGGPNPYLHANLPAWLVREAT